MGLPRRRRGRGQDLGHAAGEHRRGGGPRQVVQRAHQAGHQAAPGDHGHQRGRGPGGLQGPGLPGHGPPFLCARRPCHGDRLQVSHAHPPPPAGDTAPPPDPHSPPTGLSAVPAGLTLSQCRSCFGAWPLKTCGSCTFLLLGSGRSLDMPAGTYEAILETNQDSSGDA